jgi:hypothetical protein
MQGEMNYRITTSYACFYISTANGIVTHAAPIAKWAVGKQVATVLDYYKRKGAEIESWS